MLGQQFGGYSVEEWTPVDSLAWLKAMAWDLKGNFDGELTRARLGRMNSDQIQELFPPHDLETHPPILSAEEWAPNGPPPQGSGALGEIGVGLGDLDRAEAAFRNVQDALEAVPELLGNGEGVGSNSWSSPARSPPRVDRSWPTTRTSASGSPASSTRWGCTAVL